MTNEEMSRIVKDLQKLLVENMKAINRIIQDIKEALLDGEHEEPGAPVMRQIDPSQIWEAPTGMVTPEEVEKFAGLYEELDELVRELAERYIKDYRRRLREHREAAGGPPAVMDEYHEKLADYRKGLSDLEYRLRRAGEYLKISGQGQNLSEIELTGDVKIGDVVDDLNLCSQELTELLNAKPFEEFETSPAEEWVEEDTLQLPTFKDFMPSAPHPSAAGEFVFSAILANYINQVNNIIKREGENVRRRIAASPSNVDPAALESALDDWREKLFQVLGWVCLSISRINSASLDEILDRTKNMAVKQVLSDWRMLCRKIENSLFYYKQVQGLTPDYNQKEEVQFHFDTRKQ